VNSMTNEDCDTVWACLGMLGRRLPQRICRERSRPFPTRLLLAEADPLKAMV